MTTTILKQRKMVYSLKRYDHALNLLDYITPKVE